MNREDARELLLGYSRFISEETDLWEAIDLAIKALGGDMYCPSCGVRLIPENEYVEPKESIEGVAESATTTDCNDCIWNTCNYNKIDWEVSEDCISRKQAIEALTGWETEPLDEDIVRTLDSLPQAVPDFKTFCGMPIKEAIEVLEKYKHSPSVTPTVSDDCISRQQAIGAWDKLSKRGRTEFDQVLMTLPPVTPPKKVVAEIKVDTEELVERIKEEYQLGQEHGRLIDADKLLQELFNVDEEEWTTPEIRAILENAPAIITPKEMTGEWEHYIDRNGIPWERCSECGDSTLSVDRENINFCPNCGAKMGGDTE